MCQVVISRNAGTRMPPGRRINAAPKIVHAMPAMNAQNIDREISDGEGTQPLENRNDAPKINEHAAHAPMPRRPAVIVFGEPLPAAPVSKLSASNIKLAAVHATAPAITYGRGLKR